MMGMIYTGHNLIENFRQYRMYQTITISKYDQHGKSGFCEICCIRYYGRIFGREILHEFDGARILN